MKSEQVAGFVSESMAGFSGIRILDDLVLLIHEILPIQIGNNTGKLIVSQSTYSYVNKQESNGTESGKIWSLLQAWSLCFPIATESWKTSRLN